MDTWNNTRREYERRKNNMVNKDKTSDIIFIAFIAVSLTLLIMWVITKSTYYHTEETEIRYVEKYKIHSAGVEIWCQNNDGIFVTHDKVFPCKETNRLIIIYDIYENEKEGLKNVKETYLYLNTQEYTDYMLERMELN